MDAAFKLKTQNERTKVEDLFDYEGNANLIHNVDLKVENKN
jgi:hypothetical protein